MISQSSWQATRKATWRIVESLWKQKATKTATYNKYYSLPKWILGGATLWTAGTFLLTVAHAEQKTPQTAPSFMAPKQSQVGWDNVVKETRDVSKTLSPPMEMTLYQYAVSLLKTKLVVTANHQCRHSLVPTVTRSEQYVTTTVSLSAVWK